MDSRTKYHWKQTKCGLGVNESMQLDILDKMENLVSNMFFLTVFCQYKGHLQVTDTSTLTIVLTSSAQLSQTSD